MTLSHETFMHRCLELAANGLGSVAPNPMVGAVIVYNHRIIGEGFHTGFGKPHAEVEAVNQVKDRSLLPGSTLYVNLEPCNHQGKTPPCTDLIISSGIKKVVISQADPNSTAGGGIPRMREHGIEVVTGLMEKESRWLNRRFNTFHEQKRPWILLKWAQSTDGYVDGPRNNPALPEPVWLTDETCRRLVHKWRSEEQSILAGSNTILLDNPRLNVRAWSGNDPLRITIDRSGRLLPDDGRMGDRRLVDRRSPIHILNGEIPSVIYTCTDQKNGPNMEFVRISPVEPVWQQIFTDLYNRNIQSVLIEGGPILLQSLIDENLWDEARVFIGTTWLGDGIRAPQFPFRPNETGNAGNSRLMLFEREKR